MLQKLMTGEKFIIGKYIKLDILINNAGGGIAIKEMVNQSTENIVKNSLTTGDKIGKV